MTGSQPPAVVRLSTENGPKRDLQRLISMTVRLFIGAWREPWQAYIEQQESGLLAEQSEPFTEEDRALLREMHILLPDSEDEAESADSLPI